MTTDFPLYSHPLRAKVVMLKGVSGDTPTVEIEEIENGAKIIVTNPNGGEPIVEETEITDGVDVESATVDENQHLIITLSDGTEIDVGSITNWELDTEYDSEEESLTLTINQLNEEE